MKEIGIYNYKIFILVMLQCSALEQKLLIISLFIDTDQRSGPDQAVILFHTGIDIHNNYLSHIFLSLTFYRYGLFHLELNFRN